MPEKALVIIPTYNERDNIVELVDLIAQQTRGLDLEILVVDSNSPDGTADCIAKIQPKRPDLHLLVQTSKLGLGKAYLDGIHWAFARTYDFIITMDADFSHHPRYLTKMLQEIQSCDLVIGSRYVWGGELKSWPWTRRILSRFANWYASRLTGLPVSDLTSGFHCFRRDLLKRVLRYPLRSDGYAFLISLKFWSVVQKARVREIPIVFKDRTRGDTKINKWVILDSILFVWKIFFQRHRLETLPAPSSVPSEKELPKTCCR